VFLVLPFEDGLPVLVLCLDILGDHEKKIELAAGLSVSLEKRTSLTPAAIAVE